MRSDVHVAALKAAAKVAFSVAVLNGCGGVMGQLGGEEGGDDHAASNEAAIASGPRSPDAGAKKKALGKEPCPPEADAAPAPKASCEAVLAAAYPTPGEYQWEPVAQSKEVVDCCDAELSKNGSASPYRWECCVAYDPSATPDPRGGPQNPEHFMACTPWGPPVPPSMTRPRRSNARAVRAMAALEVA